jgi:hypothetical protein
VAHDFSKRYQKIIEDANAHSDDELDPTANCYAIKTVPYCSKAANIFFRRLDQVMQDTTASLGKISQARVRKLPKEPIISRIVKIPQSLPLDFYHRGWMRRIPISQQLSIPDLTKVAFLPNPLMSLFPREHPYHDQTENLSDSQFSKLHFQDTIHLDQLDNIEENEDEDSDEAEGGNNQHFYEGGGMIDLEAESDGYVEEGDWENYYHSDDDVDYDGKQEDARDEEGYTDNSHFPEDQSMEHNKEYVNYGGHHLDDADKEALHNQEETS